MFARGERRGSVVVGPQFPRPLRAVAPGRGQRSTVVVVGVWHFGHTGVGAGQWRRGKDEEEGGGGGGEGGGGGGKEDEEDEEDEEEEREEDEEEREDDDDDEGGGEPMVQVGVVVRATHDECVGQWCCGHRNQGVEKCDQGTCCVVQWVECR